MANSHTDMVLLPGRLLFEALAEPDNPKQITDPTKKRYRAKIQISKDSPELETLWAKITEVAQRTWGAEAPAKLANLNACIDQGIAPDKSDISIQDGDLFNPSLNSGFYLIQATRPMKKGPPIVRNIEGLPASIDDYPTGGDGVYMLVTVWAMPQYPGMNFTLESIRKVIDGEPLGGGPSEAEVCAATDAVSALPVPQALPGVVRRSALAATASAPRPAATPAPQQAPAAPPASSLRSRFGAAAPQPQPAVPVHHAEVVQDVPVTPAPAQGNARRRGLMTLD